MIPTGLPTPLTLSDVSHGETFFKIGYINDVFMWFLDVFNSSKKQLEIDYSYITHTFCRQNGIEKSKNFDYNILNKEVGTMEQTHPLRRMLNEKWSFYAYQGQDGYFLCV